MCYKKLRYRWFYTKDNSYSSNKAKNIIWQQLIEEINIAKYQNNIDGVIVGGQLNKNARSLNYKWVLSIREQCLSNNTKFEFK